MKITSRNWTLPTDSAEHFNEMMTYAKSKGVPVDKDSPNRYEKELTGIWYASEDGLHCCALEPAVFITEAEFKAMCDASTKPALRPSCYGSKGSARNPFR